MSNNKNAMIRYQVLDRCFRNSGRMYFIEDLLEACNNALMEFEPNNEGIQRRQLYDDIRFMESEQGWSIPLEKIQKGRKKFYRYSDLSFSINNQPLNISEIAQIKSALQILSRFSGSPQFEWVQESITKLESKLGLVEQQKEVISFDSNIDLKGIHFLLPLFNAIINKRVLSVHYKDFNSLDAYEVLFHPHYLKQYNNRWFVFGMNEITQISNWNLALDRIESLKEIDTKYQETEIDWDDYFYDLVGVTKPNDVALQEITLKFTPEVAPYVLTKPIHPSQKYKFDESGLEVRIQVIPNFELESLILSFGEKVKVISPENLRKQILNRVNSLMKIYEH